MLDSIKKFLIKHQEDIINFIGYFLFSICYHLKYYYNLPTVHDIVVIVICTLGIILKIINKNEKVDNILSQLFFSFVVTGTFYFIARLLIYKWF